MYENFTESSPPLLGPRLAQLRSHKGLSINDLAVSAGTSASAIHRYESGWDRFELRTLRRLAAALGARVEIRLEVPEASPQDRVRPGDLLHQLRPLFWDVTLVRSHLKENAQWVLRRVLQFGAWRDVHLARRYFGDAEMREAAEHRSMDPRTRRLWQVVLDPESSS
jgi:transcriptional regulator with XRE-family HTH domain